MGNRLTKIYTRTGDDGNTGLGDGSRVPKDDIRVEAYGTVDETNAAIGMILALEPKHDSICQYLAQIQNDLFDVGGELCIPGHLILKDRYVQRLENQLDQLNADLPPLKDFILPSGGPAAASTHLARTICRRAERCVYTLAQQQTVNPHSLAYLNRLSDLLFVMARVLSRVENKQESLWKHNRSK